MLATALFAILNKIISAIGAVITVLYNLMPSSPFTIIENTEFAGLVAMINYFLPVYEFVAIMETWLVAIGIFYLYSIFARWIKAIE
jgi:hypothetical protein